MPTPTSPPLERARAFLGRRPVILAFGAIYLLSQITIITILDPLGTDEVLRLQTTFSPETFASIKAGWIDAGLLDSYWRHFLFDFVHPVWYGLFLAALLAGGLDFARASARYDFILLAPFVAGACDFVENCLHVWFLVDPGMVANPWVAISGAFTNLKWLLFLPCFVAAAALYLRGLAIRRRGAPV